MTLANEAALSVAGDRFSAPVERCPYCPRAMTAVHPGAMSPADYSSVLVSPASHPSGVAQTESKRRIARDRSRQKRGPPSQNS
jgi:hypothetical protein